MNNNQDKEQVINFLQALMGVACNKCGQVVELDNDAFLVEAIAEGHTLQRLATRYNIEAIFRGARHFLPVGDCEGSPSRAQYIPEQPRDLRPGFAYQPELETLYRQAYAELKRQLGEYIDPNTPEQPKED